MGNFLKLLISFTKNKDINRFLIKIILITEKFKKINLEIKNSFKTPIKILKI